MSDTVLHYIAGRKTKGASTRTMDVFNPALGEKKTDVVMGTAKDVEEAVQAAKAAFPAWANMPPVRRARVMFKFLELVKRDKEKLAEAITSEHGKVFTDACGEVERGIEVLEFACGMPALLKGEYSAQASTGIDNWTFRQPLGIAAGITPFNFPVMVPMWMYPLAIAAGNCFLLKPSPTDPTASLMMADLLAEAGLPDGVFSVIQGDKESVDAILENPAISAVSFVGSTPIAHYIYEKGAANGKRVQALGGAKNHMMVMPDADLDKTVDALIGSAYGSAGERCMAISVAVLVGDVGDKIVPQLAERARTLKVKNGMELDAEMGPIVTSAAHERITGMIETGVKEGAELVVDGRGISVPGHNQGYFMGGSLFDHVTPEMSIYREEIFGPVLSCVRVDNSAAGIELINNHRYGNGVSVFTSDGNTAREFSNQIQVGMVGVNVPIPVPMAWHGFGGWKQSLFGDLHAFGNEAVQFYTKQKSVMQRWPDSIAKGAEFVMPTAK